MFRALRRRLSVYRTYRTSRALWDSYSLCSVAGKPEYEALAVLASFLDDFCTSYERLLETSKPSTSSALPPLQRIYGDLQPVLLRLVEFVYEHGHETGEIEGSEPVLLWEDMLVRALRVSSIILQDSFYRCIVEANEKLTKHIVSLLECVNHKHAKRAVLQLIASFCSDRTGRMEVARLDGFRKMLGLLHDTDDELTQEILKTLRMFLDMEAEAFDDDIDDDNDAIGSKPSRVERAVSSVEVPQRQKSDDEALDQSPKDASEDDFVHFRRTTSAARKSGTWTRSRSHVVQHPSRLRSRSVMTFGSFSRRSCFVSLAGSLLDSPCEPSTQVLLRLHSPMPFPPEFNAIDQQLQRLGTLDADADHVQGDDEAVADNVTESMRLQGALAALMSKLDTAVASHVQLDVVNTICRLLLRNRESQLEFERRGGYVLLTQLVTRLDSEEVLALVFTSVLRLLLDGDAAHLLANLACLRWICTLLCERARPLTLRLAALRCLRNLLALNALNAAAFVYYECVRKALASLLLSNDPLDAILRTEAEAVLAFVGLALVNHDSVVGDLLAVLATDALGTPAGNSALRVLSRLLRAGSAVRVSHLRALVSSLCERMRQRLSHADDDVDINQLGEDENEEKKEDDEHEEEECLQHIEVLFLATAASHASQEPDDVDEGDDIEVGVDVDEVLDVLCKCSAAPGTKGGGEMAASVLALLARSEAVLALERGARLRNNNQLDVNLTAGVDDKSGVDFPSSDGACKRLVTLLSRTDLASTRALRALSALLEAEQDPRVLERLQHDVFMQHGLVELVNIIHNRDDNHARAAIHVLRNAVARSNECKASIGDDIGFLKFAEALQNRPALLDELFFELMIELATDFHLSPHTRAAHRPALLDRTSDVIQRLERLVHDKVLDHELLRLSSPELASVILNDIPASSRHSFSSARSSSPPPADVSPSLTAAVETEDVTTTTTTKLISKATMISTTAIPSERLRRTDAIAAVLMLLSQAQLEVQVDVLRRLNLLILQSPFNQRVLCENGVLSFVLRLCVRVHESVRSSYLQLVTTAAKYSIEPHQVQLLLELASLAAAGNIELRRKLRRSVVSSSSSSPRISKPFSHRTRSQSRSTKHRHERPNPNFDSLHGVQQDHELQMQLLYVVGCIAERKAAERYLSLEGNGDDAFVYLRPLSRFPAPKIGYTFTCWVHAHHFTRDEVSLLTLSWSTSAADASTPTSTSSQLELFFKLTPHAFDVSARTLCLRTSSLGTFMFECDALFSSTSSTWQHIALSHSRAGATLLVNGVNVGHFSMPVTSSSFPSAVSKREPVQICLGGVGARMELAAIHIVESVVDQTDVIALYECGPVLADTDADVFTTLKSVASDVDVVLKNTASLHETTSIHRAIRSVGGLFLVVPLLLQGAGPCVAALRILACLLERFDPNIIDFQRRNGFSMLGHILLVECHEPPSIDTFDVLMEIACRGRSMQPQCQLDHQQRRRQQQQQQQRQLYYRRIRVAPVLTLMLDLLRASSTQTRENVVALVAELVTEHASNTGAWMESAGVIGLLELLRFAPRWSAADEGGQASKGQSGLVPSVLSILEQLLLICDAEALDLLLCFLVVETEQMLDEKAAIGELLVRCARRRQSLLEYLAAVDRLPLLFPLLSSASCSLRLSCISLLGLMFRHNEKHCAAFVRMFGFDLMLRLLAKHQNVDEAIGDALVDLALDRDVALSGASHASTSTISRSPSISHVDTFVPLIVHPEAIRLLLELLRLGSSRPALHLRYIERLGELVSSRANLDTLLAQPWLHWARQYLEGIGRHRVMTDPAMQMEASSVAGDADSVCSLEADAPDERVRHRVVTRFVRVLQKMLVHDFAIHSGRQGWLMRLRGMVEAAEFVQLLVERVLAHYEKNPRLQDDDGHVLRNLSAMIALVDELFGERLTADLCVRLVDFINVLASQNTSEMRTRMKSVGLFNERDELLLRLLRLPMDSAARFAALSQLSLDVIALDAKFRSSNALEHVLLCLHDEQASFALRVLLADIVRNQLGAHVGLRKEITRIVAEPDVCERLLADVESDKHLDDSPESRLGPFVQWYFDAAQDAVRARVLERLHKLVAPAQTSLKRAQERLQTRKMKRLHARLDKLGKAAAASERAVQDALERSETITARACRAYAMQQQSAVEERLRRAETGELAFHSVMDELERTNWRALTPPCVAYDVQESEEASRSVSSESCCKCIRLANATTLESSWELLCHIRIDHRHNPQMAVSETNSVATMPEGAADETGG